ncbi:MAG TPA: lytic transglycosylase domain-containing protein [Vicinamibacterales bacterium]
MPSAFAREAQADIVVFKNGRTMSVKSIAFAETSATMKLRDGGEVTFPAAIIARVDPDEVPYPEEPAPVEVAAAVPAVTVPAISDETLAARPFADLISTVAAAHNVDKRLVHAVIEQESNYQPRARSKKGARGLMQLMPGTARQYGVRNSYDPKSNLEAGVRHLKDLLSRMDLPLALAAYNAGEGTIKKYGGLPPYAETQNYVRSILRRVGSAAGQSGTN